LPGAKFPAVWGDRTALEQVFANLIGNALNYLDPRRPGIIEIGCLPGTQPPRELAGATENPWRTYYVKDNGLGIPAAHQAKVFQAFQRLHPAAGGGEGIGLTIVQRIVQRHQGKIWLESQAGAGTTFFVALPAAAKKPTASVFDAVLIPPLKESKT
jgi:signal transduction histidine kinase